MKKSIIALVVLSAISANAFAESDVGPLSEALENEQTMRENQSVVVNDRLDDAADRLNIAETNISKHEDGLAALSSTINNDQNLRQSQYTSIEDRVSTTENDVSQIQKDVFRTNNTVSGISKTMDVLRTNTQNSINNQIKYSDQINKRAIMNTRSIEGLTTRVVTNTNDISSLKSNKVDKTVFTADQKRQDTALANETVARIEGDKRNEKDLANINNQVTNVQGDVTDVKNDLGNEVQDRQNADSQLSQRIDTKLDTTTHEQYVAGQNVVNRTLAEGITQSQITGDYANSRIDAANSNIEANYQAIQNTNKRVAQNTSDIAQHEQRIQSLEKSTNANFSALRNEVQSNKKRADAGTASVAAMANIPQVTEYGRFSIGAGLGTRGHERAVAVGMSSRLSTNVIGKVSVSSDTQSKFTFGAGIAVQW